MKATSYSARAGGFTLVEMLVVVTIIALLAAMTMGGYTYAMRGSREKTTRATFESVKTALDSYNVDFGEFPEPAKPSQFMEFGPGKSYDVGGALCLYQAMTGDGYDQIKGVTGSNESASGSSDGKIEGIEEIKNNKLREMPSTMWMRKNNAYILVDGFNHPFQYIKASATPAPAAGGGAPQPTTINATYDLWSYSMDEMNTTKVSVDTLKAPNIAIKWIKNW